MIEIQPWVFWSLITAPFLSGVGIGAWTMQFVKESICKSRRNEIICEVNRRFIEASEEKDKMWGKIDKIYDIVVNF